jgi:uncharacterized membrane protein
MSDIAAPSAVAAGPGETVYFDAILHPNRSLSPAGFRWLMLGFSALSLSVGSYFFLIGAWPIVGFMGLDILLLYLCFKLNYRSGRTFETVRLTARELEVNRQNHWGERRSWRFQPYWLRVDLPEPVEHDSQIRLMSHGRSVTIGSFLAPEERADFASALKTALDQARRG